MNTAKADSQLKIVSEKVCTYKIKLYPPFLPNWTLTPEITPVIFEIITVKKQHQPVIQVDAVICDWWPPEIPASNRRPSKAIKENAQEVVVLLQKALEKDAFPYSVTGLTAKQIKDAASEAPSKYYRRLPS